MSTASSATSAEPKQADETASEGTGKSGRAKKRKRAKDVERSIAISLEHGRWRHFGWTLFGTIGGAGGPILAGRIFDLTDSYAPAFAALAALATLGLALVLRLPSSNPGIPR